MRVEGVGELIDRTTHWELVYARCKHRQEFARPEIDTPQQAVEREVQRYYATCLTCRRQKQHDTRE